MESSSILSDLSPYAIEGTDRVYYIPEFVSEEEETYLIRQIENAPKPKWKSLANRRLQTWGGDITATNKLLPQPLPPFLTKYPNIIGRLRATGVFSSSKNGEPNHVIVNEYLPGQGIMPHEDGPSYHPVVGTISLGAHAVFHYYRYKQAGETESSESSEIQSSTHGRVIERKPVLTLLLEPRSLVITTASLYTEHLHGIDPVTSDTFLPDESTNNETGSLSSQQTANLALLKDTTMIDVVRKGGVLNRATRVSLTCRDVERVISNLSHR